MWGTTRRGWLVTGFAPGETLAVALVMGVLLSLAFRAEGRSIAARTAQVELLFLHPATRIEWIETWANDGMRPAERTRPFADDHGGKYFSASVTPTRDGSIDFISNESVAFSPGRVITVRAALSGGADSFSIAWVCGSAAPPPGFTLLGADRSTLPESERILACRKRL